MHWPLFAYWSMLPFIIASSHSRSREMQLNGAQDLNEWMCSTVDKCISQSEAQREPFNLLIAI